MSALVTHAAWILMITFMISFSYFDLKNPRRGGPCSGGG